MKKNTFWLFFVVLFLEFLSRGLLSLYPLYNIEMTNYSTEMKIAAAFSKNSFVHKKSFSGKYMGVDIVTNKQGFRDQETEISDFNKSIWAFGDSLTLGWGVESSKSFVTLVEDKTGRQISNLGHGNYNLQRYRLLFESLIASGLRTEEAWIFYFINDAEILGEFKKPSYFLKSSFVKIIASAVMQIYLKVGDPIQSNYIDFYGQFYQEGSKGHSLLKNEIKKIAKIAENNEIRLKVFLLPDFHNFTNYPFLEVNEVVTEEFRLYNVEVTDLLPYFTNFRGREKELWVAPDDSHPNEIANKIIAQGVIENL